MWEFEVSSVISVYMVTGEDPGVLSILNIFPGDESEK